jgi:hypothetical protein
MIDSPPRLTCTLSACRGFVDMTGGAWSGRIAIADLDRWRRFYRNLSEARLAPGRDAKADPARLRTIYGPTADALDRIAAELAGGEVSA